MEALGLGVNQVLILNLLHSFWNAFWFFVRQSFKWSRSGYSEATRITPLFHSEAERVNTIYGFSDMGWRLSPANWHRNLATLWYLEQMLSTIDYTTFVRVMEPGCQNFSRLPAIDRYMSFRGWQGSILGVELDAYVPVKNFYSLYDHAQYYRSLVTSETTFEAADFFKMQNPVDLILCFYPFVSQEPALAWGLPAHFAGADKWINAFLKNLQPNGFILVVHQGDWEEKDFDKARGLHPLRLIKRQELTCPFFKTKYPARFSLYQKIESSE